MPSPKLNASDVNRATVEYFANVFGVVRREGESQRSFGFRVAAAGLQEQLKQSEALVQALHRKVR